MIFSFKSTTVVSAAAMLGLSLGCGPEPVETYRVPKEISRTADSADFAASDYHWMVPEGWEEKPAESMRLASMETPGGGNFSITILPDSPDLENANRWRRQMGKPPLSESQMEQAREILPTAVGPFHLFQFEGDRPGDPSILAAIHRRGEQAVFFKLEGAQEVIREQRPHFIKFLEGFHFAEDHDNGLLDNPESSAFAANEAAPGASSPDMSVLPGMESDVHAIPDARWEAPGHWESTSGSSVRKGSYRIGNAGETGSLDFSITAFPGDVGGYVSNINRWRGQLGLPPLNAAGIEKQTRHITVDGFDGKQILVHPDNPGPDATGILGAVVPVNGATWFFKLQGPLSLIDSEADYFDNFLSTVDFQKE